MLVEQKPEQLQTIMAKPGIPVKEPQRRAVPEVSDPLIIPIPKKVPITEPGKPVEIPSVPVPAGR